MIEAISHWQDQLQKTTEGFAEAFTHLSGTELNWKPNAKTWSIGQNVEHLIIINQTYFPILDRLDKGTYKAPFIGRFGFMTKMLGNFILTSVLPETAKKTKTIPIWEPSASEIPEDILTQFAAHQEVLAEKVAASRPHLEAGAVIASPANRHIAYTLERAFEIIVAHEKRHLKQAKEVMKTMIG